MKTSKIIARVQIPTKDGILITVNGGDKVFVRKSQYVESDDRISYEFMKAGTVVKRSDGTDYTFTKDTNSFCGSCKSSIAEVYADLKTVGICPALQIAQ